MKYSFMNVLGRLHRRSRNKRRQGRSAGLSLCLTMCVLLASPASWAATLDSIDFATQSGDRFEIMLGFDGAPPEPVSYAIESPARISIDLVGVQSQLEKKYYRIGEGSAQTVAVLEGEDRTRIIVSLPQMVPHEVTTLGRQMVVSVGRDLDRTGSQASASQSRTEELIAFRRGEQGEGRVVLRLPSEQTEVDIRQEAGNLLLTLVGVETSAAQQTQLDVTDFGTPIDRIERARIAMGTEVRVVMNQVFDYLAYQSGQELVIDVAAEGESPLQQEAIGEVVYEGEKISLNFQNIEVRAVLQIVADFANLNLVASDAVAGEITLRLKTVPWDQALDIVLKTKGLDKRLQGNVLIVAPAADLAAQELAELENKQQISDLAPLRTELIRVKYANASEIVGMIQGGGQGGQTGAGNFGGNANRGQNGEEGAAGILSDRGSVIVDDRTNSIILTETQDRINQLRRLLEQIDIPVRQVLIEARIVKASDSFKRESGIRWGSSGDITMGDDNASLVYGNNLETVAALRADPNQIPADNLIVDLGTSSGRTGGIAFGTVDSDFLLDLELELYESEGTGETISRPTIITSDKSTASVNSGSQIPYQSDTGGGATATAFINATVGLTVTPQITPDDRIILQLNVTNNSRGDPTADGPPAIDTESIQTEVIVDDGETVVLGGLYQTRTDMIQLKTPVLGDLPVVGRLFRNSARTNDKDELLIFITPRIIREGVGVR
jgi:type IV pilus assembly protein PilQ